MKKQQDGQDAWDDLEVFTAKGAKIKDPKVTILESSTFLFNAAFVHKAELTDYSHAILGYSPKIRNITFQFTKDDKAEGALTVVQRPGAASIGSRPFFNYFFLNPKELAGRYEPKLTKIPRVGEVWTINLNNRLPDK